MPITFPLIQDIDSAASRLMFMTFRNWTDYSVLYVNKKREFTLNFSSCTVTLFVGFRFLFSRCC